MGGDGFVRIKSNYVVATKLVVQNERAERIVNQIIKFTTAFRKPHRFGYPNFGSFDMGWRIGTS